MARYTLLQGGNIINVVEWDGVRPFPLAGGVTRRPFQAGDKPADLRALPSAKADKRAAIHEQAKAEHEATQYGNAELRARIIAAERAIDGATTRAQVDAVVL